jgi:hypothetical protein
VLPLHANGNGFRDPGRKYHSLTRNDPGLKSLTEDEEHESIDSSSRAMGYMSKFVGAFITEHPWTRNDRERSVQLEELVGVMKQIQGRNAVEDQGRLAPVAAD